MLEDTAAPVVLTERAVLPRLAALGRQCVCLDALPEELPRGPFPYAGSPEELLGLIIYTSGSTGRPKGAQLRRRGVLNVAECGARRFGITERDVVMQFFSFSFDASVGEMYQALLNGARLHVFSQEERLSCHDFAEAVRRVQATCGILVPAFLGALTELPEEDFAKLASLRFLQVGGEALPPGAVRAWQARQGAHAAVQRLRPHGDDVHLHGVRGAHAAARGGDVGAHRPAAAQHRGVR